MKRRLLFFVLFILFAGINTAFATTARIYAYDLNCTDNGSSYTFTFKANETPTFATLVLYSVSTGNKIAEQTLTGTLVKGENSFTIAKNILPGGGEMNWAVKLTAASISVGESLSYSTKDESTKYTRASAAVNTNPESDYSAEYIA